jgi:hypothetical protein
MEECEGRRTGSQDEQARCAPPVRPCCSPPGHQLLRTTSWTRDGLLSLLAKALPCNGAFIAFFGGSSRPTPSAFLKGSIVTRETGVPCDRDRVRARVRGTKTRRKGVVYGGGMWRVCPYCNAPSPLRTKGVAEASVACQVGWEVVLPHSQYHQPHTCLDQRCCASGMSVF